MPELPEVETIKKELSPHLQGRRITEVTLLWEKTARQPAAGEFRPRLVGRTIQNIARQGKYLILGLEGGESLVIHLGMTGSLLVKPAPTSPEKFVRAVIRLDNRTEVHFRDARKFGKMWLAQDPRTVLPRLGPDPLEEDFTPQKLAVILDEHNIPVKALLLEQNLISGIGNMYADEALFEATINPMRTAKSLSSKEIERLYEAIRRVLQAGIANLGASVDSYIRPSGEPGSAHLQFKVAHRGGEPCPVCGTPIRRLVIRNRGTYFCPKCQR